MANLPHLNLHLHHTYQQHTMPTNITDFFHQQNVRHLVTRV